MFSPTFNRPIACPQQAADAWQTGRRQTCKQQPIYVSQAWTNLRLLFVTAWAVLLPSGWLGEADLLAQTKLEIQGEDIGGSQQDRIRQLAQRMQLLGKNLAAGNLSPVIQSQQRQILADLESLSRRARDGARQSGGSPGKPKAAGGQNKAGEDKTGKPQVGKAGQPQGQAGNSSPAAGNRQADSKPDRPPGAAGSESGNQAARQAGVGKRGPAAGTSGDGRTQLQQAARRIWGHLPPEFQQRMSAAGSIRFLPKYRQRIEEYYKRLAESPLNTP